MVLNLCSQLIWRSLWSVMWWDMWSGRGIYVLSNRDLTVVLRFKWMQFFDGMEQRRVLLMVHPQSCVLLMVHPQFSRYIFIVHQFDIINLYIPLYNLGQIWDCFNSPKFLECLLIWDGGSSIRTPIRAEVLHQLN